VRKRRLAPRALLMGGPGSPMDDRAGGRTAQGMTIVALPPEVHRSQSQPSEAARTEGCRCDCSTRLNDRTPRTTVRANVCSDSCTESTDLPGDGSSCYDNESSPRPGRLVESKIARREDRPAVLRRCSGTHNNAGFARVVSGLVRIHSPTKEMP
jgi:hypothetical protein